MAIFSANQPFTFTGKNGVPRVITPGVLMSDDDPDYKGKEQFFEPIEVAAARPALSASGRGGVEDASAEPNTKRSVSTVKPHAKDAAEPATKRDSSSKE
jgi:hypothetical protein